MFQPKTEQTMTLHTQFDDLGNCTGHLAVKVLVVEKLQRQVNMTSMELIYKYVINESYPGKIKFMHYSKVFYLYFSLAGFFFTTPSVDNRYL